MFTYKTNLNIQFKLNEFGTLELAMDEKDCKEIKEIKPEDPDENGEVEEWSPPPPVEHHQPLPKENNPSRKRKAGKITPVFGTNDSKMSSKSGNYFSPCGSLDCVEEVVDTAYFLTIFPGTPLPSLFFYTPFFI